MQQHFDDVKRVLASVAALALFALNDVRMFHSLPKTPDPGNGQTHALSMQLLDASGTVYASLFDIALRWGLMGLILAACCWALAETLQPAKDAAPGQKH
jgi:hypothetical protein